MHLFLASGGISTEARLAAFRLAWFRFLPAGARVLFVPYAVLGHDAYTEGISRRLLPGCAVEGLHRKRDPRRALLEAQAVFVGGGNTFRLLKAMQDKNLLAPLRRRALAGMPYAGASAGSNLACPTIATTNDMPIVRPRSFDALGLVPFQINPHFFAGTVHYRPGLKEWGSLVPYGGESRSDRIREFHEENDSPVLGLTEGSILRVEGRRASGAAGSPELCAGGCRAWLEGGGARLFRRGQKPVDFRPGARLTPLFK